MSFVTKANWVRRLVFPKVESLDGPLATRYVPPRGEPRVLTQKRGDHYTYSVSCTLDELIGALYAYGYVSNSISTLKFVQREEDDVRSWERAAMVYRPSMFSKWQHHFFVFEADENSPYTYHIGHHKEINYLYSPSGHSNGEQYPGDPDGHLADALENSNVGYKELDYPEY